jgi:hypothetical protein
MYQRQLLIVLCCDQKAQEYGLVAEEHLLNLAKDFQRLNFSDEA